MTDMSISAFSGAAPSLASTFSKFIADPTSLAAKIIVQATNQFGADITGVRKEIAALAAQNPQLADTVRNIVTSSLSPLQVGEMLSGRTYGVAQDSSGVGAAIAAKLIARAPSTYRDFAIPSSPAAAPKTITFSPAMQAAFDGLWQQSFPGGNSKEQGATIIFNRNTGEVGLANVGGLGSTSGSFSPDLDISYLSDFGLLGAFHTHPFSASEGGYTGVSFSGGDAAYMLSEKLNIFIAQSGNNQFMYVRTAKTPNNVDVHKLKAVHNARIAQLQGQGYSFERATRMAASETANKYGLAYYDGANGTLTRVNPE